MNRLLFLVFLALPCMADVNIVMDNGSVEINGKRYDQAKLTYTLDKFEMTDFGLAKVEKEKEKAKKLRVDYKESGQNKTQNFLGKMPKVKKVKSEKVSAVDEKEKEIKK